MPRYTVQVVVTGTVDKDTLGVKPEVCLEGAIRVVIDRGISHFEIDKVKVDIVQPIKKSKLNTDDR